MSLPKKRKKPESITKPQRRPSSGYVKQLLKEYHDKYINPLAAQVALLEGLLADNMEANPEAQTLRMKADLRVDALAERVNMLQAEVAGLKARKGLFG